MNQIITFLMILLVIYLIFNPSQNIRAQNRNKIFNSPLGRLFFIGLVIYTLMGDLMLGLLLAFTIIISQNNLLVEKMENLTVGEDIEDINVAKQKILTKAETTKEKVKAKEKAKEGKEGIDKENIKTTIMAKDSKTIQLDPNVMKSLDDVKAYNPSMLTKEATLTEGFFSNFLAV